MGSSVHKEYWIPAEELEALKYLVDELARAESESAMRILSRSSVADVSRITRRNEMFLGPTKSRSVP